MTPDHAKAERDAQAWLGLVEQHWSNVDVKNMAAAYLDAIRERDELAEQVRAYRVGVEKIDRRLDEMLAGIGERRATPTEINAAIDEFKRACPDAFADIDRALGLTEEERTG